MFGWVDLVDLIDLVDSVDLVDLVDLSCFIPPRSSKLDPSALPDSAFGSPTPSLREERGYHSPRPINRNESISGY